MNLNNNYELLLKKLSVPEPKISWFMFRHGLSHTIRPFNIESNGKKYKWSIKVYKGVHHLGTDNAIIISPRKLLDDLKEYLEKFRYDNKKINIQTGVKFY